ncbi:hypothetical protein [Actinokineospora cianjurensis]|uniref:Small secreted domain DUF320 n=1 Tax=Actinokineospora cianjurensis TaxID=585224 RepID=A0A421B7G4_9PSEU|nr:hypothetical protein [Actinokineospora cianjurensis]RLK60249.1 hypothetical protein CLV68_0750 [Actinokineospora cianjurensis]
MLRRGKTYAAGLVLVLSGTTAGLLAGSGTAAAAPPIVVGSCATTIQGAPGTPISLSPAAVLDPVLRVVTAVPLLGPTLATGVRGAVTSMGNIPIGAVPAANTTIPGSTIAAAAVPKIQESIAKVPLIGTALGGIISGVQGALTAGCSITVTVVNAVTAPVQDGAGAVAGVVEQGAAALPRVLPGLPGMPTKPGTNKPPGTGGTPQTPGTGGPGTPGPGTSVIGGTTPGGLPLYGSGLAFGRSPMTDYSGIPYAQAGLFAPSPGVRYGGAVPGYSPQFGILGTGDADGVQAAGHAEALDAPFGRGIALPVLLAVFALSGVTAALVRTWVLRRTA